MHPMTQRLCIFTILASNAAIVALGLLSGCAIPGGSDCSVHYDGTPDCDPVVTANDLEGTWCNTRSPQTCLTVDQTSYPTTRYTLTIGLCTERGTLTGGLEFNPDTGSRMCLPGFTYGLWSAAEASFNDTGIYLYDISQCFHPSYCDGTAETMVWANDLDLEYQP